MSNNGILIKLESKSKLSAADWRTLDSMLDDLRGQERSWIDDICEKQEEEKDERNVRCVVISDVKIVRSVKCIKQQFKDITWMFLARDARTNAVVGFCLVVKKDDLGWSTCDGLYIKPEWRGRGIASTFLELALDKTREAGLDSMDLRVSVKNKAAKKLYEKLGFSKVAYMMEKWV